MGRHCGWLTAATAAEYRKWLDTQEWLPGIGLSREAWDVHAVYVPEAVIDITAEAERLNKVMDEVGNVTIFLSEGAGLDSIVAEMEAAYIQALFFSNGFAAALLFLTVKICGEAGAALTPPSGGCLLGRVTQ